MSSVIPYLVFPGTCKEALEFYKEALNGEITLMQTFGESPVDVSPENEHRIFNAELNAGGICLKASDDLPGHDVNLGNNISLFTVFPDAASKKEAFERLAVGGKILFPLDENFGMLKDKYNVQWMFVVDAAI